MEEGRTPMMEREQGTAAGWTLIDEIRENVHQVELRSKADEQLYAEGLDQVQRLADVWSRRRGASPASFGQS